jgi:hypothetical protein
MIKIVDQIEIQWRSLLNSDYPDLMAQTHESLIKWLLGADLERFDQLSPEQLAIASQAMDYRYRILKQRYLGSSPEKAYQNLITRLGSIVLLRNKIRTHVALSRDRQRAVADVLQEVIQELLNSDRYIQEQIKWIGQCSTEKKINNALLLTTIEEYCLRPIRNQPLLVYRFVNYLRRSQKGGMTHVPEKETIKIVSEELGGEDDDTSMNLLDHQAIVKYQDYQEWEEQQQLRTEVKDQFIKYLKQKVGADAAYWLELYLQGKSQDNIAQIMNLPIKQIYRLREKVSYHAINVFAIKAQPGLVANWLQTSIQDSFGLTPQQWEKLLNKLTPVQKQIVEKLKENQSITTISAELKLKNQQIMSEWSKLYLAAQSLRST